MTLNARQIGWFLLPWATGLVGLTLLPVLACFGLSLTRMDSARSVTELAWVGADHYRAVLGVDHAYEPDETDPWYWHLLRGRPNDPRFYQAMYNSLFYSVFAVPLGLSAALLVALLLNQPLRGMSIIRGLVYLPHVLGGVATIVIWSWLLNPEFGWINQALRLFYALLDPAVGLFSEGGTSGWPVPRWLYSPDGCKPAVILMHVWTMGGSMLIFLAALRRVEPQLYEAARLDGAGAGDRFLRITLPQITPAILFNVTMSTIFAMQSFGEAYLLQNRNQDDGLMFFVLYLYRTAFEPPYRLGYASALAVILFAVLFILVVPILWSSRRWVHYAIE